MSIHFLSGASPDEAAKAVFSEIINAGSVAALPQGSLDAIRAQAPGKREEAAAALEKLLVAALLQTAFSESQKPMSTLDALELAAIEAGAANQAITRGIYKALVVVADILGDGAQLMTRTWLQEMARLPVEQQSTIQGYAEAAARAWSHVVAIEYPDEPKKLDS